MNKLALSTVAVLAVVAVPARANELRSVGKITVGEGLLNDAFAFDEGGGKLAWIVTDAKGNVRLKIGPPGGKAQQTVDLSSFTVSPERVLFVGGSWFVVANEGERKAAVVTAGGKLTRQIGPFGECLASSAKGRAFVTVTERAGKDGGRAYDVAAYRPDGGVIAQKQVSVGADQSLVGVPGASFIGFTNGYLAALVRKPGAYNRKTDVRGPAQIAVYDVLASRVGPGKPVPNIPRFVNHSQKRNEKPGVETFVRLDDDGISLELVGPAEKLRPVALPAKLSLYEISSLQQQLAGGKLVFSLTVDPLNADQVAAQKKGARSLHVFSVDLGSAKASLLGQIPLGETQQYAWVAGGAKVAVLKKTMANGGTELTVYSR